MKSSPSPSRIWLITGAGRGLGRAFAHAALAHGDRVVGTVRRTGAMADLLTEFPGSVRGIVLDVRDAAAVAPAVEAAARAFGGLDVVVNNAGTGFVGALEEIEEQAARDHLDLNLFGALWVSRAAIPHLRARGGGDIVQISTVGAIGAMPLFGLYNAGKWALEGFTEALSGRSRSSGSGRRSLSSAGSQRTGQGRACRSPLHGPSTTTCAPHCSAPPRCPGRLRTPTPPRPMQTRLWRPTPCSPTSETPTTLSEC